VFWKMRIFAGCRLAQVPENAVYLPRTLVEEVARVVGLRLTRFDLVLDLTLRDVGEDRANMGVPGPNRRGNRRSKRKREAVDADDRLGVLGKRRLEQGFP
jgi:hypothetical protein